MNNKSKASQAADPASVPLIFANCAILDTLRGELLPGWHVLIEGDTIREVSDRPIKAAGAVVYDLAGRTLMPGLCDAHVHVTAILSDLARLDTLSPAYVGPAPSMSWRACC